MMKNPFSDYDNQITTNSMLTYYLNDFIVQNEYFVTSQWKPATFLFIISNAKRSSGCEIILYKNRWFAMK